MDYLSDTIKSIALAGTAVAVLQALRPQGSKYWKSITRIALRALQLSVALVTLDLSFSRLKIACIGLIVAATGEWLNARRLAAAERVKLLLRPSIDKLDEKLARKMPKLIEDDLQKEDLLPNTTLTQLDQMQVSNLRMAAEEMIRETSECLSDDSSRIFKIFVQTLASIRWERYCPEILTQGTPQQAVLLLTSTHEGKIPGMWDYPNYRMLTILRRLATRYVIYEKRVSSIADVNHAIDWVSSERNKTIKLLWINTHGGSKGICFSQDITSGKQFRSIHWNKLAHQASIWLDSCRVGARPSGFGMQLSPAEWIKLEAGPERRIFAPLKVTSPSSFDLLDLERCTAAIYELASDQDLRLRTKEQLIRGEGIDYQKPMTVEPQWNATVDRFKQMQTQRARRKEWTRKIAGAFRFCRGV